MRRSVAKFYEMCQIYLVPHTNTYLFQQGIELTVATVDDPRANVVRDFYLVDLVRSAMRQEEG